MYRTLRACLRPPNTRAYVRFSSSFLSTSPILSIQVVKTWSKKRKEKGKQILLEMKGIPRKQVIKE